jgi:hypothetical protein
MQRQYHGVQAHTTTQLVYRAAELLVQPRAAISMATLRDACGVHAIVVTATAANLHPLTDVDVGQLWAALTRRDDARICQSVANVKRATVSSGQCLASATALAFVSMLQLRKSTLVSCGQCSASATTLVSVSWSQQ